MVLESLISPWNAERHPWELLFIGFLYTSVAMALSLWIFKDYAGLIAVFFTVMFCIPLIYNTFRLEEEKIDYISEERSLLQEHSRAILFLIFLFIGMTLAFSVWYVVLPQELSNSVFSVQMNTIIEINSRATSSTDLLSTIFFNNLKVLTFSILFSFIFGAGAIFILTWNASIIAVAMGVIIRSHIFAETINPLFSVIGGYYNAILRYFIHGIPEITAYFIAALAGGIISVAIIKKDILTKNFQRIAFDTSNLILLSIFVLFVASIIETYLTPLFY